MAALATIRTGLQTRLQTIAGLHVYHAVPDSINVPAAIVGAPASVEYSITMGTGDSLYTLPVRLYVSRWDATRSQDLLDPYLATTGAQSIRAAIEGDRTLGGAANTTRVIRATNYGQYVIDGITYIGCDFTVEAEAT